MRAYAGFLLIWTSILAGAPGGTPLQEYSQRRAELRKQIPDGFLVLLGARDDNHAARGPFFQESNFYYLTGWNEPDAALLLMPFSPDLPQGVPTEILFIPSRSAEVEKWTGRKAAPGDPGIDTATGVANVLPREQLEEELRKAANHGAKVYTLTGDARHEKLKSVLPLRDFTDARMTIARMRMKKSDHELELIRQAIEATMEGHLAAWKRMQPGAYEYQVGAALSNAYYEHGCGRHAYAPIIGSGPNATVLHYSANRRRIDDGELVLMDAAGECQRYASDVTRTVPVNGRFTPRQRELYEIVLAAQKAVLAALKPGITMGKTTPNSAYQIAYDYFETHGKDREGNPLGKYFTHGIGHHIGLDVHDAHDPAMPLEAGHVVTVEPGLYIPEEGIGIRIEDIVLITPDGCEVLSRKLPKEVEEIERVLAELRER
jgi:Xaa-Pro aminopeptidase